MLTEDSLQSDELPAEPVSAYDLLSPSSTLTDLGRRIRDEVLEFVPTMLAQAPAAEQDRALTDEVTRRLKDIGVWDVGAPARFGGVAAGARDLVEICRAVGRGDGSAGWLAQAAANNDVLVLGYPDHVVEEVYTESAEVPGPRLVGASVFARQVGAATAVPGGWKLTGRWGFATGCRTATWAMVGVDYVRDDGGPRRGLALIPRSAYRILDDWNVTGMAATCSNTIVADEEIFVAADWFFDLREMPERMDGLADRFDGPSMRWRREARVVAITLELAAVALGLADGALESFLDAAPKRTPFNLPYATIADSPGTQISTGRSQAGISAARAVVERIADGLDRISCAGLDFTPAEASRTHMELVFAIRLCRDAIADLEETLGSSAAALSNPIQRAHRDIRVLASHGAIRFDPLCELTGKDALGRTIDPTFSGGLPSIP